MKHICTLLLLAAATQAWSIKASIDFLRFSNLDQQYIEVNYRVSAKSLNAVDTSDNIQIHKVLSTIIIYKGADIVDYQKNMLIGSADDSTKDIIDIRRFVLSPGEYTINVLLQNQNGIQNELKVERKITIEEVANFNISDIMLLATVKQSTDTSLMVRNGVYMETVPYADYGGDYQTLTSYVEFYGLQNEEKYYCSYEIVNGYNGTNGQVEIVKHKRLDVKEFQAQLFTMDISDLQSGNYHFLITVFNGLKEEVASRYANFYRSNPTADINQLSKRSGDISNSFVQYIAADSLNYYLRAIAPIVYEPRSSILDELLKDDNDIAKRRFLYDYWQERAEDNAEGACVAYMKIAKAVDRKFYNGTSLGFDTDMGYIFLRYGKPDAVVEVDDELSAVPYQMWRYNKIIATGENNVKFLFYAPSLSHKDYRLLHSTCRLELQNPSWEALLYKSIPGEVVGNASEVRSVNDGFTRRAKDLWNDL